MNLPAIFRHRTVSVVSNVTNELSSYRIFKFVHKLPNLKKNLPRVNPIEEMHTCAFPANLQPLVLVSSLVHLVRTSGFVSRLPRPAETHSSRIIFNNLMRRRAKAPTINGGSFTLPLPPPPPSPFFFLFAYSATVLGSPIVRLSVTDNLTPGLNGC